MLGASGLCLCVYFSYFWGLRAFSVPLPAPHSCSPFLCSPSILPTVLGTQETASGNGLKPHPITHQGLV